jgi:hypothetical protein
MTTIQELLTAAGHDCEGNNRNRAIKGCNTSLAAGIKIKIAPRGKCYVSSAGREYHIGVSFADRIVRFRKLGFLEPYDVLRALATLLKDEEVKAGLAGLRASTPCECGKCSGRGIIPGFMYYANGICFDCMGLGVRGNFKIAKVS